MKIVKISRQEALTTCRASFLKQKKNNFLKKWLILKLKCDTIYIYKIIKEKNYGNQGTGRNGSKRSQGNN